MLSMPWPDRVQATIDATADETVASISTIGARFIGAEAYNPHASDVAYLQLFNAATGDVTLGTTTPDAVFVIGPGQARWLGMGYTVPFSTALSYAVTTTPTGSTGPTSDLSITFYTAGA